MTNAKVTAVADQIKQILEAQTGLQATIREMLQETDISAAAEQLRAELDGSIVKTIGTMNTLAEATAQSMFRLSAAMYYLSLEPSRGKGEWRTIADEEFHLRVSVRAIHSIRKSHGLDLREAKYTIEAYQAKLFK